MVGIDAKFDGIVLAGVGDGNFYKDVFDVALKARQKGINIVRGKDGKMIKVMK